MFVRVYEYSCCLVSLAPLSLSLSPSLSLSLMRQCLGQDGNMPQHHHAWCSGRRKSNTKTHVTIIYTQGSYGHAASASVYTFPLIGVHSMHAHYIRAYIKKTHNHKHMHKHATRAHTSVFASCMRMTDACCSLSFTQHTRRQNARRCTQLALLIPYLPCWPQPGRPPAAPPPLAPQLCLKLPHAEAGRHPAPEQTKKSNVTTKHTYAHTHTYLHRHAKGCTYKSYTSACVGVHVYMYTHTHAHTSTLSHTHLTRMCTHAPARTRVP